MLDIIFSIPFYSLPLKRPNISFSVLMFLSFSFLILLTPTTNSLLLIHASTNLTLYVQHGGLKGLIPFLSPPTQPVHNAAYPSSPATDLPCYLPPLRLDPCHPCVFIQTSVFKYVLPTHSPLLAQNSTTLLPLSFSTGTPKALVRPPLALFPIHPFRTPRIYNLYPLPALSMSILSMTFQNLSLSSPSP